MILLAALLAVALLVWWTEGSYRAWQMRKNEARAKCADAGHDWITDYAYDSPWWPYRRCRRCGEQEPLKRCAACGRHVQNGRLCGEDERS